MKSAYGLKIPEPDFELTCVGPGTPCGELMRRYWQPVCLSADLQELPKRVRILGEDLIVFRDGQGRAGLLFFRCSHPARPWSTDASKSEEFAVVITVGYTTLKATFSKCRWSPLPIRSLNRSNIPVIRCASSAVWSLRTWGLWTSCRSFLSTTCGKGKVASSRREWDRGWAVR